jgi:hypothetical protein
MQQLEVKSTFGVDDSGAITGNAWVFGVADSKAALSGLSVGQVSSSFPP